MSIAVNRILANNANAVREAVITAAGLRPSTDLRLQSQHRQGRGRMTLTGPYTGASDSLVEVEVTAGAGSALRTTTPVITGVGNGLLTVTGVDAGATRETLTFTLADPGDPATYAELAFYGVTLRATSPGAAGNALRITVTRRLVFSPLPYATLSSLGAGVAEVEGPQWDFGAVPATTPGVPGGAARIAFEGYPQIHRHWKAWTNGRWVYRFDPAPGWAIAADTQVQGVSGDYQLVLTDGTVSETYEAVTCYDFLSAVQARSALVDVVGVVVADTAAGGQAVTDIPLRTDAHALPVDAHITGRYGKTYLDQVTAAPTAPTENVRIACLGLVASGTEAWTVSGSVSGTLGTAYSGEAFASAVCGFTIPDANVPPEVNSRIAAIYTPTSREDAEGKPAVCFKPLRIGAKATAKTVTFEYQARPPADCHCEDLPALTLNAACLGLTGPDGGAMALDPAYQTRLTSLYDWRADFFRTQSDLTTPPEAKWAQQDMDLCDLVVESMAKTLEQTYSVAAAMTEWDAAFLILKNDFTPMDGVGAAATALIATGMAVGTVGRNPANRCVYRLDGVHFEHVYNGETKESKDLATLDLGVNFAASGWTTAAGSISTIVHVDSGHIPTGIGQPTVAYSQTTTATFSCLGLAPDLIPAASPEQLKRRYAARMDHVLTLAGIVPKSDASSRGDGCWRDDPSATTWWVDVTGRYLPMFTNQPYVSCVKDGEGKPYSTQEFGVGLVVDCAERLKEGDKIQIAIDGASVSGYAEGDLFVLPIIGAAAAPFGGGEDGDATQTWAVSGSVGGAYPDWLWNPSAPSPYTAGPVDATLAPGGIPFEQGDAIRLSVEGGQLRWRRDGGAWTLADLYGGAVSLGNGLSLTAVPGPAPSFLAGDTWSFRAAATYGPDRLRQPREGQALEWIGASVTLNVDLGTSTPIEAVLIALHTLPDTAAVTIRGGVAAANEWTLTPAWTAGPWLAMAPAGTQARYLSLQVTGAGAGAAIGWLWAGVPWAPTTGVSSMQHVRQYGLTRAGGRNPTALYRGRGTGGNWAWSLDAEAALLPADVDGLIALLDHIAEQGLEWVCLVPDVGAPQSATLAQIDADGVTLTEHLGFRLDGGALYSADLPFRAVLL